MVFEEHFAQQKKETKHTEPTQQARWRSWQPTASRDASAAASSEPKYSSQTALNGVQ